MDAARKRQGALDLWFDALGAVDTQSIRRARGQIVIGDVIACAGILGFVLTSGYSLYWLLFIPVHIAITVFHLRNPRLSDSKMPTGDDAVNPARDARVAKRLMSGEITGNEFCEKTPGPFKPFFRPQVNPTRAQRIGRVLQAWDEYCGTPSPLGPIPWASMLPVMLVPAVAFFVFIAITGPRENLPWLFMMMFLSPGMLRMSGQITDFRLKILAREFERLGDGASTTGDAGVSPEAAEEPDTVPPGDTPDLTLIELNRLGNETQYFMQGVLHPQTILAFAAAMMMLFCAMPGHIPVVMTILIVAAPAIFLPLALLPELIRNLPAAKAHTEEIRRALRTGDLLKRITSGDAARELKALEVPPIYKLLFRLPAMPAGLDREKHGDLWLAATNLDWVIKAPESPERRWWSMTGVQLAGLVVLLIIGIQGYFLMFAPQPMPMPDFNAPAEDMFKDLYEYNDPVLNPSPARLAAILVTVGIVFLCMIPGWIHHAKTIIWRRELFTMLRGITRR